MAKYGCEVEGDFEPTYLKFSACKIAIASLDGKLKGLGLNPANTIPFKA